MLQSDSAAHCSRAVLRECTKNSELIELYIDIQMIINAMPQFASEPDSVYNIAVETSPTSVPLPAIIDKQKQDYYTVLIERVPDTDEAYFQFVTYDKPSHSLLFQPQVWNRGQTYYFNLKLADPARGLLFHEQLSTVIVDDGLSVRPRSRDYTDLIFAIQKLKQVDDYLACTMRFNRNIDTALLTEGGEFREMFDIYWTDRGGGEKKAWESIEITSSKTNTIDFTAFLSGTTTVKGVMVAKVRPQYDYTRVFLTDPEKTYLTNLNATKEFKYLRQSPEPVVPANVTEEEPTAEIVPKPPPEPVEEESQK